MILVDSGAACWLQRASTRSSTTGGPQSATMGNSSSKWAWWNYHEHAGACASYLFAFSCRTSLQNVLGFLKVQLRIVSRGDNPGHRSCNDNMCGNRGPRILFGECFSIGQIVVTPCHCCKPTLLPALSQSAGWDSRLDFGRLLPPKNGSKEKHHFLGESFIIGWLEAQDKPF